VKSVVGFFMLEELLLTVGAWRWFETGQLPGLVRAGWAREIHGAVPLGQVRAIRLGRWPWLTPQTLEVLETEDASLVLTLRHGWFGFGRWRVTDAEERTLGSILTPHVLDAEGQRFATVVQAATPGKWQLLRGADLCAEMTIAADGSLRLEFASALEENPFLRMMLLGAALVRQALPPLTAAA
jgi:hypothetical protein